MEYRINLTNISLSLVILLWVVFVTNIALLSSSAVLLFSIVVLCISLMHIGRSKLFKGFILMSRRVKIVLALLLLINTHYLVLAAINGALSSQILILMKSFMGFILALITAAHLALNFKNTHRLSTPIRLIISIVFLSVIVQFFMPEFWNSIAEGSERFHSDEGQSGRAFGLMFNSLDLVFLCVISLLARAIFDKDSDVKKGFNLFLSMALFLMLFLTFSRSAFLIIFLAILFQPLSRFEKVFLLLITAFIFYFLYQSGLLYGSGLDRIDDLFGSISTFFTGHSTDNRTLIITTVIEGADKVPFFGLGLSGRTIVLPDAWRSHNMLIETFLCLGYFGLFNIILLYGFISRIFWKSLPSLSAKVFVITLPLISIMTIGHLWFTFSWYLFVTLAFAAESIKRKNLTSA